MSGPGSDTKTANPGVQQPADIPDKTKADKPLQGYLKRAYDAFKSELGTDLGLKTHVPISIYLRTNNGPHVYGGIFDREFHYSASLIKMAAMFAAFRLRKEAELLATAINTSKVSPGTPAGFFSQLAAKFNKADAVAGITSVASVNNPPKYDQVLTVTGIANPPALKIAFVPGFSTHIEKMIVDSNNCSAGECIVTLGYPYINVKLMEEKFEGDPLFVKASWNTATPLGIWLCGDYINTGCFNESKKQTYVRTTTVNDCGTAGNNCGSAQNTSSKEMAAMTLRIITGELVDTQASGEMRKLMEDGQKPSAPHTAYLTRLSTAPRLFDVMGVKVGYGPIKPDTARVGLVNIRSEAVIIRWKVPADAAAFKDKLKARNMHPDAEGAVCWQNLDEGLTTDGLVKIINKAVDDFINQATI